MNEITRIHIAKVPYEIEPEAKRQIEAYMRDLTAYAQDDELLQDIEIRITELLAERGVKQDGVINISDVQAIQEKLGRPEDFADTDSSEPSYKASAVPSQRRLYRDQDDAIIGGVLSGLAKYANVDPLWVRLTFVVLTFITSGGLILLYVLLWIIMPAAKSTAQKLQMAGRPVTLASIKEISQSSEYQERRRTIATTLQKILLIASGVVFLLAAVSVLVMTFGIAYGINGGIGGVPEQFNGRTAYLISLGLAIASGVLLSAFFAIVATVCLKRHLPKRLLVAMVIITALGLTTFGTAVGIYAYDNWQHENRLVASMRTEQINAPVGLGGIKSVVLQNQNFNAVINYEVSNEQRISFESLPGTKRPKFEVKDNQLIITVPPYDDSQSNFIRSTISVRGPALETIDAAGGSFNYKGNAAKLIVKATDRSAVELVDGTIARLEATVMGNASLGATSSTVDQVTTNLGAGGNVVLATVQTLAVTAPRTCPSGQAAYVSVEGTNTNSYTLNGASEVLQQRSDNCLELWVGER